MAKFRLSNETKKELKKIAEKKASELADEAREKLSNYYMTLLDWYYVDYQPKLDKYGVPYYIRTFNLYKSCNPYKHESHEIYHGGVKISADSMKDYDSIRPNDYYGDKFAAEILLNGFIYNPDGTWHGGDWHGGYGTPASFNIYEEIRKYRDKLIKEFGNPTINVKL